MSVWEIGTVCPAMIVVIVFHPMNRITVKAVTMIFVQNAAATAKSVTPRCAEGA